MNAADRWAKGEIAFLVFLTLGSSALLLTHLTQSYLWNDEGSTACLARTILTHGVPMGYDGANSLSAEEGRDLTKSGIYKFQPWLQFYVVAASFVLFGESTFTARLPFALFGIATILLTYFLAWETWKNRAAAAAASLILMLSVPFLLLAGQCRYYSASAFFSVLALWSYLRILDGQARDCNPLSLDFPNHKREARDCNPLSVPRNGASAVFAIAVLALLHTNHGHALALLPAVVLHAAIWHREKARRLLVLSACMVLVNLPWLLWMSTSRYSVFSVHKTVIGVLAFLFQLAVYAPHPVFVVALIVLAFAGRKRDVRIGDRVGVFLLFGVVLISMVSAAMRVPYFRYLAPLLPLTSVIAGKIVTASWRLNRVWTVVVVAVWLITGLLPLYLYELTQEHRGPIRGIVTYLNEQARPGDTVAIGYEDLSLKFYTGLHVIGGYTGEDLSPAKQAEWIIPRKYGNPPVRDYLLRELPLDRYQKIVLDGCPDTMFENRESPYDHRFRTATHEEPVVIYHRVNP